MASGPIASKVLVVGSAEGKLRQVFAKISAIHAKTPFTFCVCSGDLFGDLTDDSPDLIALLKGEIVIPLECFCILGGKPLPSSVQAAIAKGNGEICPNLVFLGKQAIYTTATGLRIAAFGGSFDLDAFTSGEGASSALDNPHFTSSSHAAFLTSLATPPKSAPPGSPALPIDILLTHAWPAGITLHSASPPADPDAATFGNPAIAEIVAAARPRYHFATAQSLFYEREPFAWPVAAPTDAPSYTRFFGLGDFANTKKERWFYAFSITPGAVQPAPANATACPIVMANKPRGMKRSAADQSTSNNFIFDEGLSGGAYEEGRKRFKGGRGKRGGGAGPVKEITPSECYFCLANPKLTKHLIVSIGTEAYVTLPVGQVPDTSKRNTPVPGGGHVLIIPIAHFPTLHSLPDEQATSVIPEIERYKTALAACYATFNCVAVSYEVGRFSGRGGHAHVQVCPIPKAQAGEVEAAFREEAKALDMPLEEDVEAALEARPDNYFRVDLPDGRKLLHIITPEVRFDLQFGRIVLSRLLGTPDRYDWRQCRISEADEKVDTVAFKKAFAPYDPA